MRGSDRGSALSGGDALKISKRAQYIAAALIHVSGRDGVSVRRKEVSELITSTWRVDVTDNDISSALRILNRCDIAYSEDDEFAGSFVTISLRRFEKFMDLVDSDRRRYEEIANSDIDQNAAINRAESLNYQFLDVLNEFPVLRRYGAFGGDWLHEAMAKLNNRELIPLDSGSTSIDSSNWTGRKIIKGRHDELVTMLENAAKKIDDISLPNSEKATVRAYIVAAGLLAESPDPPDEIIWELISRANNICGVASLFVSILALFSAVGH